MTSPTPPAPTNPAATPNATPAAMPPAPPVEMVPRRSKLVTWTSMSFGWLQILTVVMGLITIVTALVHFDSLTLFMTGNCLDHLTLVPVLLSVILLILAKNNRYVKAAKRLSWMVIVHYLVKVFMTVVYSVALMVVFFMMGFKLQNSANPVDDLVKAQNKAIGLHPGLFLFLLGATVVIEILFLLLWLGFVRSLRGGHFLPPPPPTPAPTPAPALPPAAPPAAPAATGQATPPRG